MIKAIIFDFDGPIVTRNNKEIYKRHEIQHSLEAGSLENVMDKYHHGANLAEYETIFEFYKKTKPSINLAVEKLNDIFLEVNSTVRVRPEMVKYIEEIKKRYKTAILSNYNSELENLLKNVFKIYHLFDVVVNSYNLKISKPNPKIYQHMLEKLNVKADEAVFIDDKERNTKAAEALGIKSIIFQDFNQFKKDLTKILEIRI
jgi:epoxide hydrolase-like predicted phosphatase